MKTYAVSFCFPRKDGNFIEVTIAGMLGKGSIRHNNRTFHAVNVDRKRTAQNVIFRNEDIQKVYHELFDEALAEYNAMEVAEIQPEQGFLGGVKGVTVEEIETLKKLAIRGAVDRYELGKMKEENEILRKKVSSINQQQKTANLTRQNDDLTAENEYLKDCLAREYGFTERLLGSVERMLRFIEKNVPESLKPVRDKARKFLPERPKLEQREQERKVRKNEPTR